MLDQARAAGEPGAVVVASGGTIMACFHQLADEPGSFHDWRATYCGGYVAEAHCDDGRWSLRDCTPFARLVDVLPKLLPEGRAEG